MLWLMALAPLAPAAAGDARLEIRVGQTAWDILPNQVYDVRVGPDQRTWFILSTVQPPETLDALKATIEAEFNQPAPQLRGVAPVLFEPTGRVWFVAHGKLQTQLVGYDGKSWVDHALQAGHRLAGGAPGHWRGERGRFNQFSAGHAFFPDGHGVESFDGQRWSYARLAPFSAKRADAPVLHVEPDGEGITAVVATDPPALWRWREGAWTEQAPPLLGRFQQFAPSAEGIWILELDGSVRFWPYRPRNDSPIDRWIAELAEPDAADEAAEALLGLGLSAAGQLQKRLEQIEHPIITERLQRILVELRGTRRPVSRVGPFLLHGVRALDYLPDRRLYIPAAEIVEGKISHGPGILIVDSQGNSRLLRSKEAFEAWPLGRGGGGPLLIGQDRVWLPPSHDVRGPARLFDLRNGQVTAQLPDERFQHLRAARDDQTVFASHTTPARGRPLVAFTPKADLPPSLPVQTLQVSGPIAAIAPDGSVWTHQRNRGILRFDGERWVELNRLADARAVEWILPGPRQSALIRADRKHLLIGPGIEAEAQDLPELILEHREQVLDLFPQGARQPASGIPILLVDAQQNLWLMQNQRLQVLWGNRWLDPSMGLKALGSPVGTARFIASVGDGSNVYVTDWDRCSALGELRKGVIVFTPVPGPTVSQAKWLYAAVQERDGGFWVPAARSRTGVGGQFPQKITHDGVVAEVAKQGWPILADLDGNVWFAQGPLDRAERFNIRHAGEVAATLEITGGGENVVLFASEPGKVYAWTDTGLQRYVAREPGRPQFKVDRKWVLSGIRRHIRRVQFSSLGYVVVLADPDLNEQGAYIQLIRIDGRDEVMGAEDR